MVRVSWERARAFCEWLGAVTGEAFDLPTESQWEYACRAGGDAPLWYGPPEMDFSPFENLADASFLRVETHDPWKLPSGAIHPWRLARAEFNDGYRVSAPVGSFAPNPFGLHDMLGNAAEWTRDACTSAEGGPAVRTVRGGSWADRPEKAIARRPYATWQSVYNVGFRVVCPAADR